MASGHPRRGNTEDELFLGSHSPAGTPIQPLRIQKRVGSPSDISQGTASPPPQNSFFPHPVQRRPTLPSAAGSAFDSPNLPYPDRPAAERMAGQQQQPHQQFQQGDLPYPDRERNNRSRQDSAVAPSPERASTPQSAASTGTPQPTRHVSVVHADAYPTPPPFRQREGRPQRLPRQNSRPESPPPHPPPGGEGGPSPDPLLNPFPQFHQQYWPPPSRMTSTSTTAARRGSPPPPETPATATTEQPLVTFPANVAAQRRGGARGRSNTGQSRTPPQTQVSTPPAQPPTEAPVEAPPRPWTPTEAPGSYPHGPPTVWQGTGGQEVPTQTGGGQPSAPQNSVSVNAQAQQALEQDFQRMNMSASPPPSYASLNHAGAGPSNGTTAQGYPNEKHTVVVGAAAPQEPPHNNHTTHPAFHNDPPQGQLQRAPQPSAQSQPQQQPQQQQPQQQQPQQQQPQQQQPQQQEQQQQHPQPHPQEHSQSPHPSFTQEQPHFTPPPRVGPSPPPPLPEGWMAHLDPNSGQYYYIHIPTSRTQWEPPVPEPAFNPPPVASPSLSTSTYSNVPPLASPGFPPPMAAYADPGVGGMSSPAPPLVHNNSFPIQPPIPQLPLAGIALYNVAPANGEYFGPYLRYTNMNIEHGVWLGSIMIITANPQPPTVHLHQSIDLSPNPRQLKANPIYTHKTWTFYRYDIDIQMGDMGAKWTYAITSHLGCTRYEFLVAGRTERNWRFIAHSCNDFSLGVKAEERARLGGVGFMWKDVMQKHIETGGFHAQLAGGDQIYADRLWREIPLLKEWLEIRGKENRKAAPWTAAHEEEVTHAYFHYYSAHFDQPHLREAWAQIPHLCQIDDHDIFDGFGSYPEYMQFSSMFKNIGRVAVHWYLLFQHHTTLDILHASSDDRDLFTVTGTGWHFVKYLGPAIAVVGIDCRSERNPQQVMAGPTYQGIFPRIATLPPSVQHCILMISVPVIYPRLDTAESVVNTVATGKKAVTGTYNLLGKVVGSAAGIVGGKEVVGSGFQSVKKAFGKSGLMSGVVSVFGEVDLLDDLRDHWTHESKDLERTYLIRTLQGISHSRSIRMTFMSGDVHCCGAGLVHDPTKPQDHKTMYQIIASGIVNAPLPNVVLKILHNNKPLYVPQNGMRSTGAPSDTKEDMLEIFQTDVTGQFRELKKLMGRRNYAIFCAFDPQSAAGSPIGAPSAQGGSLSLAVDFIVQGEGVYSSTAKYGPVVVPRVEFGY